MSDRHVADNRTIHPRALAEFGEKQCIHALGVARDLRSGAIPPEKYDQSHYGDTKDCGTPACIAWHIAYRLGYRGSVYDWVLPLCELDGLNELFSRTSQPTQIEAADAIERYVYDGSETPWEK